MSDSTRLMFDLGAWSLIVFALAGSVAWLLRKQSAAVRHQVWLTALLMLPVTASLRTVLPGVLSDEWLKFSKEDKASADKPAARSKK